MNRQIVWIGGAGALLVIAIAALGVWYVLFRNDAPPPVDLDSAIAAAGSPSAGASTATAGTTPAAGSTATNNDSLAGGWQVASGSQSFVGYRVQEQLANIGGSTAVGRTSAITGSLLFDGSKITAVSIEADLTKLASDRSQRDNALRQQALEISRYPTASFKLTQPIQLDHTPAAGETISATAVGDLTIHGVTKPVSMPLQGQLTDGRVVVVGSLDIVFADYQIQQPRAASVLSVDDHGVIELQLMFSH